MKKTVLLVGCFVALNFSLRAQLTHVIGTPDGFATLGNGITGGEGGSIVTVTSTTELEESLDNTAPLIILVDSTITIDSEISCRGDKTIVGLGTNARIKGGGLAWNTKTNIIIQNIIFEGSGDDMLKINNTCENIWVDHCTIRDSETGISDGVDGGLDITRESKYITVSYCHFYNHDKNMLIGHSDGYPQDTAIRVTIHHCYFDGTIQRNPRVRYGTVHCYNNYYVGNSTYGIASACDAKVLVENCYFKNVPSPIIVGVPGYSPAGWLVERGSIFVNCGSPQTKVKEMDFTEYYEYTLDSACMVPALALTLAGCGMPHKGDTALTYPECEPDTAGPSKYIPATHTIKQSENLLVMDSKIQFSWPETGPLEITIYDISGRKIDVPFRGWVKGEVVNSIDFNSSLLSKGIYICVMSTGNEQIGKKFKVQ